MQEERDYLVKQVFPELRKRCRERAVEFVEVDLRWGVTEEQAERGEVLPICLREIELCRPYFIGLLGERYGWVPDKIDPQLLAEQPWLADHREHSITALEMVYGVLKNPKMAHRAYFYFRDPNYIESLPENRRHDFIAEDPEARAKLMKLKDRIRVSGLFLRENYSDPEAVGKLILEDLWKVIDQEFPTREVPDSLAREAADHEAFALSRAKVYIGRQENFGRLNQHMESDDPPLVICGESGVGKSALLANWLLDYRKKHPDAFVFVHFIGSTSQSTDYVALLHRLISEIKQHHNEPGEVPFQPEKLREVLPFWLAKNAARGAMLLILDALDQLENKDNAPDLDWLPESFAPNMRVFLSTLPGRPLQAIEKRGWPTFTVERLVPGEVRQVIREYLAIYRKTLDRPLIEEIAAKDQATNPLYLRALLEELRLFGIFEKRVDYLHHYLAAPDPPALYNLILERLEEDYEKPCSGLVEQAMSFIWAARRGLMENELLELLGKDGQPLPKAFWSPLALALEESLISRSGYLTFFHDYLCQAVKKRYLSTQKAVKARHLSLASYFQNVNLSIRKVEELPWQLARTSSWKNLYLLLSDLNFLKYAWGINEFEVKTFWTKVEDSDPNLNIIKAYKHIFDNPQNEIPLNILSIICDLMMNTGNFLEAIKLSYSSFKHSNNIEDLNFHFNLLAIGALNHGNYDYAIHYYRISLEFWKKLEKDYSAIEEWSRESGYSIEELQNNLSTIITNIIFQVSIVLFKQNKLNEACNLLKEAENYCLKYKEINVLIHILGSQGVLLEMNGEFDQAMSLYEECERLSRQSNNIELLAESFGGQASVSSKNGHHEEALVFLDKAETLYKQIGNIKGIAMTKANIGAICAKQGKLASALKNFDEAAGFFRKDADIQFLITVLMDQARVSMRLLRWSQGLNHLEEAHHLAETYAFGDLIDQIRSLQSYCQTKLQLV
jgi:hypothetical protein